jgi:integrase
MDDASRKILEKMAEPDQAKDKSISDAVKSFIADCETRIKAPSVNKYRQTLNPLLQFCSTKGISTVAALAKMDVLRTFVNTWTDAPRTRGKKIERLRTFLEFCKDMAWCQQNPAKKIKRPKITTLPVVPFTAKEYAAILKAISKYPQKNSFGYNNRKRMRAFILTLRYTALRMSDAVTLRCGHVADGRLLLHTTKTGTPVHLPLHPDLLAALKAVANGSPYYFWNGEGKVKSAISVWQRSFNTLLKLAGITGHPHQFRHMMAIELLEQGVNVEHVAAILGNTPNIVYKHYAPWIESRQKALDAAVKSVWAA